MNRRKFLGGTLAAIGGAIAAKLDGMGRRRPLTADEMPVRLPPDKPKPEPLFPPVENYQAKAGGVALTSCQLSYDKMMAYPWEPK